MILSISQLCKHKSQMRLAKLIPPIPPPQKRSDFGRVWHVIQSESAWIG